MRELLMIAVGTAFINNVVLSQFLGLLVLEMMRQL